MLSPSEQQEKLIAASDVLDYEKVIQYFPWIVEQNRKCILSTDSDGFLCGLAMTNFLNWQVVGFYDGKVLLKDKEVNVQDCTFLDVEINRRGIASIGNHLIQYNKKVDVLNFNFDNCIQPNLIRGFDGKIAFQQKYPFATIHLLLGILQKANVVSEISKDAVGPLIFADGTGNNLFGYPENCLDWMRFLGVDQDYHILNPFLCNSDFNFYEIMEHLKEFFQMRDQYNAQGYYSATTNSYQAGGRNKRSGHQLKISNSKGEVINLLSQGGDTITIYEEERNRIVGFIEEVGRLMKWEYNADKWTWSNMEASVFQKGLLSGMTVDPTKRLNNKTYEALFAQNPFSLAMTASDRIEYTVERGESIV